MTPAIDITAEQRRTVLALLNRHLPDTTTWAYGSRVKWTSRAESDLDLVVFARPEQGARVAELREAFEESDLPFRVDLFVWDEVPERFKARIEANHVVLVSKNASRVNQGWRMMSFSSAILLNPPVSIERGKTYPFVDMAAINAGSRCVYATQHRRYSGGGSRFRTGDTLMARITPCLENGKIARYCGFDASESAHGSTEFVVIRGRPDVTDTEFAYYLTQWDGVHGYAIGQMTGTSGRQRVSTESLNHLTVPVPPIQEQRDIAHILGALDDKIELNRRMNETLEAMAQSLFKSWFVDFDPVRARMEGRDTGLPQPIADLFPDRLTDSELGQIPEGWQISKFTKYIDIARGLSYKGSELSENGLVMHNLNSIHEGGGYKYHGLKHYGGDYKKHHIANPGDVIVANTEQGHDRLLIGYAAIVPKRYRDGIFTHHLYKIQQKDPFNPDYIYHLLNTKVVHDVVSGYATGTTVNMLPADALQIPRIVIPTPQIAVTFGTVAKTIRERSEAIYEESEKFANLRDTLLPKLISGKLHVKERMVAS